MIIEVAADASFYICFLDDINLPNKLNQILDFTKAHMPPIVQSEVKKSKKWNDVKGHKNIHFFNVCPIRAGEALKPFFSKEQKAKGEHEIISFSYVISYTSSNQFYCIVDDMSARKFIENNLPELSSYSTGTPGYIEKCCLEHKKLNKEDSIMILNKIKESKFRIPGQIINEMIERIRK